MRLIDPIDRNALMVKLGIVQNCEACEFHETIFCDWKPNAVDVCEAICDAPTIEPERKIGRWLPDNNNYITPHFVCSACGVSQKVETVMYSPIWTFCPRCGAAMTEEEAQE